MGLVSDAELIRAWQRGDANAFAELVRRWQQPLARFLHHVAGSGEQTTDLCQEVFLRVCRSAASYRADGAFSTWLYRIAVNVARDAARRLKVRKPPGEANQDPILDYRHPVPERRSEERELAEAVAAALAQLPEEQRLVLVLRHYEGVSFEEIARLTHAPVSTIKSRFTAALRRTRARLEELGFGPEEIRQ